jgi:hypothetical protein
VAGKQVLDQKEVAAIINSKYLPSTEQVIVERTLEESKLAPTFINQSNILEPQKSET